MPRGWTRKERKEHIAERYFELKKKLFIIITLVIVFILLIYGIIHSTQTGNTFLAGLLAIILIVLVPLTIFLIDMVTWESA